MNLLSADFHVVAIDLPGVGRSTGYARGDKRTVARYVHAVIQAAGLTNVTLVGHDVGGQIVYAYLHEFPKAVTRAAILNVAVPAIDPWSEVLRSPYIWHFAFHAIAELPETLVAGHQKEYFEFFYKALAANPAGITSDARRAYADAYRTPEALKAGFDWYRGFQQDEKDKSTWMGAKFSTPVLYIRGDKESGRIRSYLEGFRKAGLINLHSKIIADCGHFSAEEQPDALAAALREFAAAT